jgi:hypothetical protein
VNYKETLYFIAKCLTISLEEKNRHAIEKKIQSGNIDWDTVVKVSTDHLVFSALYCNLKRVDFLQYLPQELLSYMVYITDINRERNKKIITQAEDLNSVLLANNITPIFLKGTGNLLVGIYEDIGERMVGDIDFIISKKDYTKAITILREFGYSNVSNNKYDFPNQKHYRRLQKENNIAAVEIHKELLLGKYNNEFNYNFVNKDSQVIQGINFLSYSNKLNLSTIVHQIGDNGFYYKNFILRQAYDVFLLSKKTNAKAAVNSLDKLTNPLNCFLATCYEVFNNVDSLEYDKNSKTASYLSDFNSQLTNSVKTKRKHNRIKRYLLIKSRLNLIYKCFINREFQVWLLNLLTEKEFYKRRLVELKKVKSPNNARLLHK